MNEIVLPDPFAPLLQFLQSINQSLEAAQIQQQKFQQQFRLCQVQLQDSIEGVLERDEAIRELERRSENMKKEISGVMFIDEENDVVEEIFVDSIGDATSVDLSLVKIPADSGLKIYSFHTHPQFGNPNFSPADMEVSRARSWEAGHCILTEIGGDMVVNCMEL